MLSIRVSALPIHGQIFDHVEVSTQYNLIYGCDITLQFVKEGLTLKGDVGSVNVSYLEFIFLCFNSNRNDAACLVRVFKFCFKVFALFA